MRKASIISGVVVALLLATVAFAGGVQISTGGTIYTFTDCSATGSVAQTIPKGTYFVTVNDEAVFMCVADSGASCGSGGTKLPAGAMFQQVIGAGGQSVACRSATPSGDLQFTPASF